MSELMKEPCQLQVARTMAHMVGSGEHGHIGLGISLPYRTPMEVARAQRIVACVNACAGVPTEILQAWLNPPDGQMGLPQGPWHRHLVALGAQRAKLAELLQAWLAIDDWTDGSIAPPELIAETKAALAALEGLTFEEAA